jgi:tetratricopeptide (TPR) repeat protein
LRRRLVPSLTPALVALLTLVGSNGYAQQTPTSTRYRLLVAERNSALELVLPTIELSAVQRNSPPRSAFIDPRDSFAESGAPLLWAHKTSKKPAELATLMVLVVSAPQVQSAQAFRDFALKKETKGAWEIKTAEHNGILLARYKTDSPTSLLNAAYGPAVARGKSTDRNLEAFLVNEKIQARIRFTSSSLDTEDESLFYSIIDSAKFVDTLHPSNSFDYYSLGRAFSARKDYLRAVENFALAMQLERSSRKLNRQQLYRLIMTSAEAYAAISKLSKAAEVLEYGVSQEPSNTVFLMQLARTYAALRDSEKTLATLKTTFLWMKREKEIFENTTFPGTTSHAMSLPDLSRDPAFKELLKDKAFRDAVKEMKK